MKMRILAVLLAAGALLPASGQSRSPAAAVIIWVEGEEFEVRDRQGNPAVSDDLIGWPLHEGDTLITYDHTFVELELLPSRNVIKIAENTDFRLESAAGGRESSFAMLYGSVRARVQKLARDERFRIRGSSAIAGVRGTDFGMDVLIRQGGTESGAVTQVYCFEGEVEVQPQAETPAPQGGDGALRAPGSSADGLPPVASSPAGTAPGPQAGAAAPAPPVLPPVIVRADEMVTVAARPMEAPAPQVEPLPPAIRSYWDSHPFQGRLLSAAGTWWVEEAPAAAQARPVPAPPVLADIDAELAKMIRSRRLTGGALLGFGVLLDAAALLILPLAERSAAHHDATTLLLFGGAFCLSGGLLTLLSAHQMGAPAAAGR